MTTNSPMEDEGFDWTINNLDLAGLSTAEYSAQTHYKRPESFTMKKSLDEILASDCPRVWISGSPGVGKSTTLFGILNTEDIASQGYLWIHTDGVDFYVIVRSTDGSAKYARFYLMSGRLLITSFELISG